MKDNEYKVMLVPTDGNTDNYPAIAVSIGHKEAFYAEKETIYGWVGCPIRTPHRTYHMLFLSDQPVKIGDMAWEADTQRIFKIVREPQKDGDWRKIVAWSLNDDDAPKIPLDFIGRYVAANGNIDTVTLEMEAHTDNAPPEEEMDLPWRAYVEYRPTVDSETGEVAIEKVPLNRDIIRTVFHEENGIEWKNSQGEPDIDYVMWLEDKLMGDSINYINLRK